MIVLRKSDYDRKTKAKILMIEGDPGSLWTRTVNHDHNQDRRRISQKSWTDFVDRDRLVI